MTVGPGRGRRGRRRARRRAAAAPPRAGAIAGVDTRVLRRGRPAAYVAHRTDGRWLVGARGFTDRPETGFAPTTVGIVLEIDPTCGPAFRIPRGWHAWRTTTADGWQTARSPAGATWLLTYELRPTDANPSRSKIGGAFANAWIVRPSLLAAREVARAGVEAGGWRIVTTKREVALKPATSSAVARKYAAQALVDGEVYVFHTWPAPRKRRG